MNLHLHDLASKTLLENYLMLEKINPYRYLILLLALMNLIITPLISGLFGIPGGHLSLINYTLLILSCILTAQRKKVRLTTIFIGIVTLLFVWLEYFYPENYPSTFRMLSTLILFSIATYILIRNFIDAKEINLSVIFGAMAGYLLIGVIGGVLFELLDFFYTDTVNVDQGINSYDYYYFSFISLITIGFGDITPVSPPAKSLTILLSVIGQFYMAVGISLFVGKHLNKMTK